MQDLAKQQKIDLEKPDEAAAALKGALRGVNVQEERKGLEDAQNEFAGSRNALEKFLTDFRADAEGFRGDLELLRKAKAAKKDRAEKKQEIEQHEHEAGGDLEHAYDATVSVLKSLVDVATAMAHGPLVVFDFVQSGMELPGVDLIKDWIKSDQTTDEKIDLLFDSVEQIAGIQLAMLRDGARVHAQKLADYKKEFVGFYDAYMTAAGIVGRRFQELQKMVDGAARKSGKSGSSDARGLMAVNAAVARNAQAYEKVNALKSVSREFAELPYWYAQLVPLGKLVFDGRDPDPGMLQMMVYQKGGRQTIFHLPPQGLRTSLEDLSKGLQALQKFSEADVARAGRLATRWEQAIINAL